MHWDFATILLILAAIVPWKGYTRVRTLLGSHSLESGERIALYISTIAFQWAISIVIVWRCFAHGLSLAQLGLILPRAAPGITATLAISSVLVLNQILGVSRLARLPVEKRGVIGQLAERLLPRSRTERWVAVALILTVAACEEFIYRGFIQSIFQGMSHSFTTAAFVSAIFFATAHAYQGKRGIVITLAIGLIFSGVRIWTNSLLPPMVIHFAVDLSAGMASIRLLSPGYFE